jgi:hypothetical protein
MRTRRLTSSFAGALIAAAVVAQPQTPRTPEELIADLHRGRPEAIAALRRDPGPAAAALLADLQPRVQAARIDRRTVLDLDALSALGVAEAAVLDALIALAERAPADTAARLLRTIGDLAPLATDPNRLQRWLDQHPKEAAVERAEVALRRRQNGPLAPATEMDRIRTRLRLAGVTDLPELLARIASDDLDECELASERLATFGPRAAAALPALLRVMQAPPASGRAIPRNGSGRGRLPPASVLHLPSDAPLAAALAIVAIAPRGPEALAAHARILASGTDEQRIATLLALRLRDDAPEVQLALILPLLEARDRPQVCREALVSLTTLGAAAKSARGKIQRLVDRDRGLRGAAQAALRAIHREMQLAEGRRRV